MFNKWQEKINYFGTGEEGFTLIELMIVISVLGILAGIAIPRFSGVQDKAKIAAVESDLRNIQTGLEMYKAENGSYPTSVSLITEYVEFEGLDNYSFEADSEYDYTISTSVGGVEVTLTPGGISTTDD
ncbi:type IV pilin protein [Acetohalobium arabaticum]|uniref:Type II secretion system protein G n=1 Tax=Acetohalobium arabaticum (strain ATCC 49924 / DSM 5501 / Z-7288) TaxID=574087 RepID=D9QRY4_ACEAZ|nr:prepilin-type N-terminal cleavage/methylation domain-containing protein [Acetohalobium arabaticum]ADL13275.1 type II secretion system protein G [Acetohalobium arabaticum DSM 5501]